MSDTDTIVVVSVLDSALDVHAMGVTIGDYLRTRDYGLVREKAGERLTKFTLRRIPTSVFQRHIMRAASDSERRLRAFECGVTSIDGFRWTEGGSLEPREGTGRMRTASGEIATWTEAELELLPPCYVEEIGAIAEVRSFLVRGSAVTYPLLPMSLDALAARVAVERPAVPIQPAAAPQTSAAPPASTRPTGADVSAKATPATVTGGVTASPGGL